MTIDPVHSVSSAAEDRTQPKSLTEAAKQFEALLIGQMLRSARESGSGDWAGGNDGPNAQMQDLAEQNLAQAMASQGGLGLASMILAQLGPDGKPAAPQSDASQSASPQSTAPPK